MKYYKINGGYYLSGDVYVSGSKNSALPVICASLIFKKKVCLYNIPNIKDVTVLLDILRNNGVYISFDNDCLIIDSSSIKSNIIKDCLCSKLRASYYLLGSLVNLFDCVEIAKQGGCNFGDRPIDIHKSVFEQLGYEFIEYEYGYKVAKINQTKRVIKFNKVSMGATINGILASLKENVMIRLKNVSFEPEIDDLIEFLNEVGYRIKRVGKDIVVYSTRNIVEDISYKIMFDRIEAGSYAILSSLVGSNVTIHNFVASHNVSLLNVLDKMNVKYKCTDNSISIYKSNDIKSINIDVDVYPKFPTDLIQMLSILMINTDDISYFKDNIYHNRYSQLLELIDHGVVIDVSDNNVAVYGNKTFNNGVFYGKDLRGTMALIMYALNSGGESRVYGIEYLERGYCNVFDKLLSLGACIEECYDEE